MYPNINAECGRNNISKNKLADMLHVNRKTLSNWLKLGKIPANKLIEMSEIFGVSIDYLVEHSKKEVK